MVLPQSEFHLLVIAIVALLCLSVWPSLYYAGTKGRFELFYFDFALGVMLAAALYVFTLGSLGFDGFEVMDDLGHASKRALVCAFAGGLLLNLGTVLLTGALSVARMSVAFPISMGLALALGLGLRMTGISESNKLLHSAGLAAVLIAVLIGIFAYTARVAQEKAERAQKTGKPAKGPGPFKGILLSILSGLLIAGSYELISQARPPETGLGPYAILLMIAAAVGLSTPVLGIVLLNLPIEGEPLEILDFLKQHPADHLKGLFAGLLWCTGILGGLLVTVPALDFHLSRPVYVALTWSQPLLVALLGLALWREARGGKAGALTAVQLILLTAGIGLVALA